jgi:chromosome partitioning protein
MKTVAVSLQKGGVGKTTTAVSLAAELARKQGNCLLIDLDPQGTATTWLAPAGLEYELADALKDTITPQQILLKTNFPGLSLLPTAGKGGDLKEFSEQAAGNRPYCLDDVIKSFRSDFSTCIIDMSPAMGALERCGLFAADEVLTPVSPDFFGIDGLDIFAFNLAEHRKRWRTNGLPLYNKIVVNGLDNRIEQHKTILSKIKESNFEVYVIPVEPAFRRCQNAHLLVHQFPGVKKETLEALNRLADAIIGSK